jgi:adenosylcobinamide amidohydrolase
MCALPQREVRVNACSPSRAAPSDVGAPELRVTQEDRWLVASFSRPVRACSWAIVGGGLVEVDHVAWLEVQDADLRPPVDAIELLELRLAERRLSRAVGLLTSRRVSTYRDARAEHGSLQARCLATVGLGNALRAGDPPGVAGRIGTINVLVHVSTPLSDLALLEASAIATEAKAAAVLEAGVRSRRSALPATGTGTDCTVVSCEISRARPAVYAGKHTAVGAVVGEAVFNAVSAGARAWLAEHRT